ncbi:uncharacterized protein LOC106453866 [Brassica napus]|uniref:uncharacterized protein LOC106453866 n=1 Tax=Brassica napus TaxID=3708 RepID=UPI0006AA9B30|nr:uncharacterized protein LOC106453866 [Brassica napus]
MDFIERLPTLNAINVILVVIDRLSKFGHVIGLKHPFTSVNVAKSFVQEIVKLHWDPPPLHRFEAGYTTNFELQNSLQERNMMLVQLKHNLSRAQDIMKNQADKSRGDVELEVGSMVYLKLRLYRQKSVEKHLFQKLAAKVFGPYKVLENIEKSAYRLELPPEPHIHHVFHISQIKQALGHHDQCIELPPVCLGDALLDFEPEEVLDNCYSAIVDLELLVKWTQNDELETSWLLYREFVE